MTAAPLPLPPNERHISDLLWRIEHAESRLGSLEADARIVRRELDTARAALADVARSTRCHEPVKADANPPHDIGDLRPAARRPSPRRNP